MHLKYFTSISKLISHFSLSRLLTITILTLSILPACQTNKTKDETSASLNSKYADFISSYTSGVISVIDPIKVKLARDFGDSLVGQDIGNDIFSFSPAIDGNTYWQDNRTLVFQPSANLKNNHSYSATLDLKVLFPTIDNDREEFSFDFQTLQQNFEINIGGIKLYDKSNLKRIKLEGNIQTADYSILENIKKVVTARQSGKQLVINWSASAIKNQYDFVIEEIVRADEPGSIELVLDGTAIDVDKSEKQIIEIPSLTDYKVVSAKLVHDDGNYISILFSDPLDERQNLSGLVRFTDDNSNPRVVINLNELKVFPTREIHGSAEINISSSIKSINGSKLKSDFKTNIQFTQIKPDVRFVDSNNKPIMPSTDGLVLPFEAVGLNAVDVIVVKIYENNILQYLQINSLGSNDQLRRVGKPIIKKTIPLNTSGVTNLFKWNRFSLDLKDIISAEPGALYEVQIGFQKKQSLYSCAESTEPSDLEDFDESWGAEDDDDSYWDQYESYYFDGFNWQDRDNPCTFSYYGKRRSINKILLSSDMGIIAKKRDDGILHVFVTNLLDTEPMQGVNIEVFDYQQQLIASGKTNKEGKAVFDVKEEPFIIVSKKDNQTGYLKLDDGSSLSLSNFDISGKKLKNGLKGFIYGERGVWRPADTVHLGFILEDMAKEIPVQHPVIMELHNPMGQLIARKVSSKPTGNMYRFDFLTASDAPTGNWQAKAKVGGAVFYKTVKIETIKPNRLKVKLTFDKDKFTATDRFVTGDLSVRWLSGAKAGGLKAEYELLLTPAKTVFDGYNNYVFDDASKDFYSDRSMAYSGKLNAEGNARVSIDLGRTMDAPGALNAKLFGKVYEEGGNFSITTVTIPYYPYTSFVGVNTPEGDKRGMLLTDEDHKIQIVTVDADGNPVSRKGLKVKLYKLDWRWWWDNSYDYISNYVGTSYSSPYLTGSANTTNGKGEWTLRVNKPDWGRFFVQIEDPESGHSTGKVIYLDWPGWAGKGKRGGVDGASMLDFSTDKDVYQVGEKITVSVPSTDGNRILVSLESGSEVLESYWVPTKIGNTQITFDATSKMAPNVYAHITMIQPHAQTRNDLPIRLYGIKSIKVVNPSTVLEPVIKMPSELRPEENFTIKVSEKSGREMAYTLALVDEGLLDITNYKTPDPWSSFFSREALGIKTWDVYDDVMGAYAGKLEHLLAIGGDGEIQPKEEKEANRFKPVVKFIGPFYLKKGETLQHKIQMPQYVGSVKTMVVAANKGAFGKAEQITPVKQSLMILATLPRVAGPSEVLKLPVNIFTLDDKIKNVALSVETNDGFTLVGDNKRTVSFSEAGDKVVYFDLKTKAALGVGKVKVTAKSGNLSSSYDIELNILPRNPETTSIADKVVNVGEAWQMGYSPVGIPGQNSGSIEVSSLPSLNINKRLSYLIRYPHGCIEQTTSAVFAQLYLSKLTTISTKKEADIQRNITAGIDRLKSFQVESGGLSYWPGANYANNWGTNYAGHFLLEAKDAGFANTDNILTNWLRYQTKKARAWSHLSSDDDNDLVQAYRLYTLALAGKPAMGAMNRMQENANITNEARWRLALAYARAGYDKQALKIIENLPATVVENYNSYRYTYGSTLRNKAMILETLLELDKQEQAFELLMDIAKKMGDGDRWLSTQTTAYCFISIAKYTDKFALDEKSEVSISLNGNIENISGNDFVNILPITQADKISEIEIINNGKAPIFARIIRTGTPIEGNEEVIKRNISFDISYHDLDGNKLDITKLSQGTNFKATVTVTNPGLKGFYNEVALTQIFPSGWEIINTRLDGSETSNSNSKYMDIRDDRVMHYFDLKSNQTSKFTVLLNASYQGTFYLPSISVGAMYDNSIFANTAGRWVKVLGEGK